MNRKKDFSRIVRLIRQADPEVILRAAALCDGHSIMKPAAFVEAGLPTEVVEFATTTYRSDGTPKGTIFVDGTPVAELVGVYGLNLLTLMADALGVEYRQCMGRGFQAAAIQTALKLRLSPPPPPNASSATEPSLPHPSR